jgi:hypothetical protein
VRVFVFPNAFVKLVRETLKVWFRRRKKAAKDLLGRRIEAYVSSEFFEDFDLGHGDPIALRKECANAPTFA